MNQTKVNNFLTAVNVLIAVGLVVGGYYYFQNGKKKPAGVPPQVQSAQKVIVNTA